MKLSIGCALGFSFTLCACGTTPTTDAGSDAGNDVVSMADTASDASAPVYTSYTEGATPASVTFTDVCASGGTAIPITNMDESLSADGVVTVPFAFPLYAGRYTGMRVSTNGWFSFSQYLTDSAPRHEQGPATLPSDGAPNAAVYALWEDLAVRDMMSICTGTIGTAPSRTFVVEWKGAMFNTATTATTPLGNLTFEVQLHEADGAIDVLYQTLDAGAGLESRLTQVTVGVENEADLGTSHPGNLATRATMAPAAGAGIRFTPHL